MKIWQEQLASFFIAIILLVSILWIDGSHYDTAQRMGLVLFLGGFCLMLCLFVIKTIIRYPNFGFVLGLWMISIWTSFFFSQTKNYGFSEAIIYTVGSFFLFLAGGIKRRNMVLHILVGITLLSAFYGFWYFPTHSETRMAGLFLGASDPRHFFPNAFASLLLMTWPLSLLLKKKLAIIGTLTVFITALYLTFSRGAWVIGGMQLLALTVFFIKWKSSVFKKNISIIGITLVIIFFLISSLLSIRSKNFANISVAEKIEFKNSESLTSLTERKDFWRGSLKLMTKKPLTGFGPMSFRYIYPQVQKIFLGISDHPHNWLLKMGVENGLVAMGIFILFLILIFLQWFRSFMVRNIEIFVCGIGFFGGLLHSMEDYNMNFINNIFFFFLLAGVLMSFQQAKKQPALSIVSVTFWIGLALMSSLLSLKEANVTFALRAHPDEPLRYQSSLMAREFFRREGEKRLQTKKNKEAYGLFKIHLEKNPLDARVYALKGNYTQALALDPLNYFWYYRGSLESQKQISPEFLARVKKLLHDYEFLLEKNIHYTAFTGNPIEAARIYDLLGQHEKALEIKEKSRLIQKTYGEEQQFNKHLAPRTVFDIIRSHAKPSLQQDRTAPGERTP